jgi:uncharacterized protein involved in exopolysaccharide biosynthesis
MYLTEFLASCRRRWWLALALVVATVYVCVLAFRTIPPDYEAEASLVLIPPPDAEDPSSNRYLELGSLSSSVDVLARSMVSADTAKRLEEEVPNVEYDVTNDFSTSAPIVLVLASGTDRAAADRMLDLLLAEIPQTLDRLQSDIDVQPQNRITTQEVSRDTKPEVNNKSRIRLVAVAGAALLFASGVLVAAVDGLLIRRSRRRAASRSGEPDPDSGGDPLPADAPDEEVPRAADDGLPTVLHESDFRWDPATEDQAGRDRRGLTGAQHDPVR